ncbi:hypothetical protein FRC18_011343 [Serendipita sp. 400]|nr:hypothetical protein FRC18_011343 [Serendipita sp. 400]
MAFGLGGFDGLDSTSDYMSNGVGDSQYWDWKNLGNNIRGVAEEFANFMPVDMDFGLPAFQLYDTPIKGSYSNLNGN